MTTPLIPGDTSADERSSACLAHVLQVVGWWIAPLIIFAVKRDSKFVAFHALQALLFQLCFLFAWFVAVFGWVAIVMLAVFKSGADKQAQPPPAIFLTMPLLWLMFMALWALMLIVAIVYGIKANRGEWAAYPVVGGWARRILHI